MNGTQWREIMINFERGGTNVDADLGFSDADAMLANAQLAARIGG